MMRNLKKLYLNISEGTRAAVWFAMCAFFQKGISFITVPIFTRILSTDDFGYASLYSSWFSVIYIVISMAGCAGIIYKGALVYEHLGESFYSSLLGYCTTTSIVGAGIVLIAKRFIELPLYFIILIIVQSIVTAAYDIWAQKQRFNVKYIKLVVFTALSCVISVLIAVIVTIFINTNKADWKVISQSGTLTLFYAIIFIYIFVKGKRYYNREVWRFAIKYNTPLVFHCLGMIILAQSDRIMIGKMCDNKSVALYALVYNISMIISPIKDAINSAFHPWIYKKLNNKEYIEIGDKADIVLILVSIISLMVSMIAPEIVMILAPKDYYEAVWLVPIISLSVVYMYLYTMFANIETFYLRTNYIMIGTVCSAILNLALNFYFIRTYGYVAAAYTTLVCYIFLSIIHYICMCYVLKEEKITSKIYHIKKNVVIVLATTVLSLLIRYLYSSVVLRYLIIATFIVVIFICRKRIVKYIK